MGSPSRTSTDTDCRRRACPARISIRRGYWIIVLPQQSQRDDRSQLDIFIISTITHVYYARLPWIKIKPTAQHTPARDNTLQQDSRYVHRIHLSSPGRRGISSEPSLSCIAVVLPLSKQKRDQQDSHSPALPECRPGPSRSHKCHRQPG